MPKNKKPQPSPTFTLPSLQSDADCITEIVKITSVGSRLDARREQVKRDAQELALQASVDILAMEAEHDARINNLRAYCEQHRKRLTDDGRTKTVRFATGSVSWRFAPPKVTWRGTNAEDLIELIKKNAKAALLFLRSKPEIDKEAMARHADLAKSISPKVKIKSAGEEFYVEPLSPEVSDAVQS